MEQVTDPLLLKSIQNAPDNQMEPAVDPNTGQPITLPPGDPMADFLYGLRKPIDTGASLLSRGLVAAAPAGSSFEQWALGQQQAVQDANKQAQEAYKAASGGTIPAFSPQRLLGEAITTAPLSYAIPGSTAASFGTRLLSNAAGGALSSVLTGDRNASAADLGAEAAQGAALGAPAAALSGTVARVAQPAMSMPGSDVRKLMDIGVRPTIGQATGGAVNRIEQAVGNTFPIFGDMIKGARRRAIMDFNTGVINDALSPIGETVGEKTGRDALIDMGDKISDAYNRAVPSAGGQLDPQFSQDLTALIQNAQLMPYSQRSQFNNYVKQYVLDRISPNGSMTGDSFKTAESDLGKAARDYLYNPANDTDTRNLGGALRQTQSILRDWLGRSNPQAAADIGAANAAFARMQRIDAAASRPGVEPSVFSPAQFQGAVYNQANSKAQLRRGQALSQDLADAGRSVLGPTIPDSGTPFGHAVQLGAAALLGGAGHEAGLLTPERVALGLGAGAGIGAIYNPVSQGLVAHLLASRYPWMGAVATGSRMASPLMATGLSEEQGALPGGLLGMQ